MVVYRSAFSPRSLRFVFVPRTSLCLKVVTQIELDAKSPYIQARLRHYYRHLTETLFVICLSLATTIE